MKTQRALKIAKREWGNIRSSLEMYGDIGEFDPINSGIVFESGDLPLVRDLIEMDNRLPTYGYLTQEAAYVFSILASSAGERLGLVGRLAQTFGSGYRWVRTGWFDPIGMEKQCIAKHLFFFKIFFPVGGYSNWDFNAPEVKTKLKAILYKFVAWQDNPRSYIQDVRNCRAGLEPLWHGLSLVLGFSIVDSSETHQMDSY